eukprot:snap_masked-scaffold_24-processed-gene-0.27-mRNA-1 protein AED:1.00 eAED:1.00 QI:0/0/0/0/1/1/5/0/513
MRSNTKPIMENLIASNSKQTKKQGIYSNTNNVSHPDVFGLHSIPSATSEVPSASSINFDDSRLHESFSTFTPLNGKENLSRHSAYEVPLPSEIKSTSKDRVFYTNALKGLNYRKKVKSQIFYCLGGIFLITLGISIFLFSNGGRKERTEPPQEEILGPEIEKALEYCNGTALESNLVRIGASVETREGTDGLRVTVSDVNLSCFPKNAFSKTNIDFSDIYEVEFLNVNITIIEKDALDFGGITYDFINTNIIYFLNQTAGKSTLRLEGQTNIEYYPKLAGFRMFYTKDMPNIKFTDSFLEFLTNGEITYFHFIRSLSQEKIEEFEQRLSSSEFMFNTTKAILSFLFLENSFTHIPENLFSSSNLKFQDYCNIQFISNRIESFHPNVFLGQETANRLHLSVGNEPLITRVPEAFLRANPYQMRLASTQIKDLVGIDFSKLTKLEYFSLTYSPVAEVCAANQTEFRANLSIVYLPKFGRSTFYFQHNKIRNIRSPRLYINIKEYSINKYKYKFYY